MGEQQCTRWTCDACKQSVVVDAYYDEAERSLDEPGWVYPMPQGWTRYEHNLKTYIICVACGVKLDDLIADFFDP